MEELAKAWQINETKIFTYAKTSPNGLNGQDAEDRLQKYGQNIVGGGKARSPWTILISQFKNWLIIMLLCASVVSFFLGASLDGMVIILLVVLSSLFGFVQEHKAEKVIGDLKKFITQKCRVLREGKWIEINSVNLVPGDVIEVRIGDKIPADMRFTLTDNLAIDESILTGESFPVAKNTMLSRRDRQILGQLYFH